VPSIINNYKVEEDEVGGTDVTNGEKRKVLVGKPEGKH
jgi:hypothetical protein